MFQPLNNSQKEKSHKYTLYTIFFKITHWPEIRILVCQYFESEIKFNCLKPQCHRQDLTRLLRRSYAFCATMHNVQRTDFDYNDVSIILPTVTKRNLNTPTLVWRLKFPFYLSNNVQIVTYMWCYRTSNWSKTHFQRPVRNKL